MIADLVDLFQVPWRAVLHADVVDFNEEMVDRLLQVLDGSAVAEERERMEAQTLLETLTKPNSATTRHPSLHLIDEGLMDDLTSWHGFAYQRHIKTLLFSDEDVTESARSGWETYVHGCNGAFVAWGKRIRRFFLNDPQAIRIIDNAPHICRLVLNAYRHVGVLAHPPFLTRDLFQDVVTHLDEVKIGLCEVSCPVEVH